MPGIVLAEKKPGSVLTEKKDVKVKKIIALQGKDFIQSCGEAWQCILCKKVCSNRVKAIIHIEDDHSSALNVGNDEAIADTTPHSSPHAWICDICKTVCSTKEKAILHMQKSHMISRNRAIEKSIKKVNL